MLPCNAFLSLCIVCCFTSMALSRNISWQDHTEDGDYIVLNGDTLTLSGTNRINGMLEIQAGGILSVDSAKDMTLYVNNIDISGSLVIGEENHPYAHQAVIELACNSPLSFDDERRKGIVVRRGGSVELFGERGFGDTWTKLQDTAEVGSTCLTFNSPSNWKEGDEIVIPSSDFDPYQTEKRTIVGFQDDCVKIDRPLAYSHFGLMTEGVDQRTEVGLLTRNIVFRGCQENQSTDARIGGHMMFMDGFQTAQIQGIELQNFGQGDRKERHPFHFHLCGILETERAYLRGNSVHDSNSQAVNIQATHGLLVESFVAYNITDHAFVLEDGCEHDNIFYHNLIVLVQDKSRFNERERQKTFSPSAFYLQNPANTLIGNAVAAVDGSGFWLHTHSTVKGRSLELGIYAHIKPYKTSFGVVVGNSVHSSTMAFKIESLESEEKEVAITTAYSTPQTYSPDEMPVLRHMIVHHCRYGGYFELVRVVIDYWVIADVTEGLKMLTEGNAPALAAEAYVSNSIFVGGTENRGNLVENDWQDLNYLEGRTESAVDRSEEVRTGITLHGGFLNITDSTFLKWRSEPCLDYINPAIGAKTDKASSMQISAFIQNVRFDEGTNYRLYDSNRNGDGEKTSFIRDTDGSLTGYGTASLLSDQAFYYTSKCAKKDFVGVICPHEYANFQISSFASDTVSSEDGGLRLLRNNVEPSNSELPHLDLSGAFVSEVNGYSYHPILSPQASYTMHFTQHTPSNLTMSMQNTEREQIFTISIIYPAGTAVQAVQSHAKEEFSVMGELNDNTCVNCYFYQADRGLLQLRLKEGRKFDTETYACPIDGCTSVNVLAKVPDNAGIASVDASVLSSLKLTGDSWTSTSFDENQLPDDGQNDGSWCDIDDPCLSAIDEDNRKAGVLAYQYENCDGPDCFDSSCRYCKLAISSAPQSLVTCPFGPKSDEFTREDQAQTSRKELARAFTRSSVVDNGQCMKNVPEEDLANGIKSYFDATCQNGGVGCRADEVNCRFCKAWSTNKSGHLLPCPGGLDEALVKAANSECLSYVSESQAATGIAVLLDESCSYGGLGCVDRRCRLCQQTYDTAWWYLNECSRVGVDMEDEQYRTETFKPLRADDCSMVLMEPTMGNVVSAYRDNTCSLDDDGCVTESCRVCTTSDELYAQSDLPLCPPDLPIDGNSDIVSSQDDNSMSKNHNECALEVSYEKMVEGISAVHHEDCELNGGTGDCIAQTPCQYCQFLLTDRSKPLKLCFTDLTPKSCGEMGTRLEIPGVTIQYQAKCDTATKESVAGCIGLTSCQLCNSGGIPRAFDYKLDQCDENAASDFSAVTRADEGTFRKIGEETTQSKQTRRTFQWTAMAFGIMGVLALVIGGILVHVNRYRGKRFEEDELWTPKQERSKWTSAAQSQESILKAQIPHELP